MPRSGTATRASIRSNSPPCSFVSAMTPAQTGVAAAAAVRWQPPRLAAAAVLAFVLIVVWRGISNLLGLNGDYVPAVSVGDTLCLVAGALGPAAVAFPPCSAGCQPWLAALSASL